MPSALSGTGSGILGLVPGFLVAVYLHVVLESVLIGGFGGNSVFGALGRHYFLFLFLRWGWTRWLLRGDGGRRGGRFSLGVGLLGSHQGQGGRPLAARRSARAFAAGDPGVGIRRMTKNCWPMVQRLVVVQ